MNRLIQVEDANGITRTKDAPDNVYVDIICALSAKGDSSKQTDVQQHIEYDMQLFAEPDKIFEPGDSVTIKRFGRLNPSAAMELKFEVIGKSMIYATHVQIKLKAVDVA
ncbi:hypothetical protein [Paenibacillus popilliae]|uniref:hypothetical protein n=1 Tax=Paenibacillus popilliae TaxID=78057 RepID=UPI0002F68A4F|nr:hypothetical protein [Paenibacillus popilliae]